MRILDLFDMYFLAMILIQGSVVLAVDARSFKKGSKDNASKKAGRLGFSAIIVAITLFILRWIFQGDF